MFASTSSVFPLDGAGGGGACWLPEWSFNNRDQSEALLCTKLSVAPHLPRESPAAQRGSSDLTGLPSSFLALSFALTRLARYGPARPNGFSFPGDAEAVSGCLLGLLLLTVWVCVKSSSQFPCPCLLCVSCICYALLAAVAFLRQHERLCLD